MTDMTNTPIVGNFIYYNLNGEISSEAITKVGRKYFYTRKHDWGNPAKWSLDALEEVKDRGLHRTCHLSRQSLEESNENSNLRGELSTLFQHGNRHGLTLDQLRRIKAIVEEAT